MKLINATIDLRDETVQKAMTKIGKVLNKLLFVKFLNIYINK